MSQLSTFIQKADPAVLAATISAGTSIIVLALTGLFRFLADKYALSYRLRKEFAFEQKRQLKNEIAKTKMRLLNAAEDFNFRLWNLSNNINERWHNQPSKDWSSRDNYYLHSFVYRMLVLLNLIFQTEQSVLTYDSTIFSSRDEDIVYLKYIKSIKNYFCDLLMLKEFDYGGEPATNHFFRDYLAEYVKYVSDENGNIISYNSYLSKIEQNHKSIDQVIQYIAEIEDQAGNINHNVMMGFHLLLMGFLNRYGHDYHRTVPRKIKKRYNPMLWIGKRKERILRCSPTKANTRKEYAHGEPTG
jgi:hypothetical protein